MPSPRTAAPYETAPRPSTAPREPAAGERAKVRISGIVNTRNEAQNIRYAVSSLTTWCDEVIVMDQESTDDTAAIARAAGATVLTHPHTGYVEAARQAAVDAAGGEWLMILDADEIVPPALGPILRGIAQRGAADLVMIPRKNIILGRWLRYGQWWPNRKPRLFRRDAVEIRDVIHSGLVPRADARRLSIPGREDHALWHYSYDSFDDLMEKTNRYTTVEARQRKRLRRASVRGLFRGAVKSFWGEYIRGGGLRDGSTGLSVAVIRAFYRFLIEVKTWDEPARLSRLAEYEDSKAQLLGLDVSDDGAVAAPR